VTSPSIAKVTAPQRHDPRIIAAPPDSFAPPDELDGPLRGPGCQRRSRSMTCFRKEYHEPIEARRQGSRSRYGSR